MNYVFSVGTRVRNRCKFNQTGEVTTCVPGNGRDAWYYVQWDDGSSDRYWESDLELE